MLTKKILVTGAAGNVGREVVEGLRIQGAQVLALSREPAKLRVPAGVEVAAGDLNAPETLGQALEGVRAVFLYAQGGALPELMAVMQRAGVEQVVVLSTIDATNEHPYARHNRQRHLAVEQAVADAGFRWTCLRPGAFASNALRFWGRDIARGVVRLPFPEAQQAPVDERDIAAIAVRALTSSELDSLAPVVTGPESLTQRQQLARIAEVLDRPLRVETISEVEAREQLGHVTLPAYAELLLRQWADEVGTPALVTDAVVRFTGQPATHYAAWVARNVDAFRAFSS